MSIEEKAKEIFVPQEYMECENASDEAYMKRDAFQRGANWMLEKAIDWLQDHVNDYLFDDGTPERPWLKCSACMFDAFKKAMEDKR